MENLKRKENDSTARNVMEKIYRNIKEKLLDSNLLCFWTRITSSVQIESRGTHSE